MRRRLLLVGLAVFGVVFAAVYALVLILAASVEDTDGRPLLTLVPNPKEKA